MNAAERRAQIERIPWVRRLPEPVPCTGRKSGTPMKAMYSMYGKPPAGLDGYRCKVPARWHFTALKKSRATDGDFCFNHLIHRGLLYDQDESVRLERWLARQAAQDSVDAGA